MASKVALAMGPGYSGKRSLSRMGSAIDRPIARKIQRRSMPPRRARNEGLSEPLCSCIVRGSVQLFER
jgi:hypothetical protein